MDNQNVYKAVGFRDKPVESITLTVDMVIPECSTLEEQKRIFKHEAEAMMIVLERLPGGTFDALLGLMFAKKASQWVIPIDS
jgi:hypothetical protein